MKRTWKNFAVRLTALLLFFVMIAAIVLYNAGVYDVSFIKRPTKLPYETEWVTGGPDTETGEGTEDEDVPPSYTETFENETAVSDEDAEKLLGLILSLSEVKSSGWKVSTSIFGEDSSVARLDFDFGDGKNVFSARKETVSRNMLCESSDGSYSVMYISDTVDAPSVKLYFGLVFFDDGAKVSVYNPDGKVIIKDFEGTLVYAKTNDGLPVVEIEEKYYAIHKTKGLTEEISESEINFLALKLDYPEYYASSGSIKLYPFSEYVTEYVEITTAPPETEPPETTTEEETTEGETAEGETTEGETTSDDGSETVVETTEASLETTEPEEITTAPETTTEASEETAAETTGEEPMPVNLPRSVAETEIDPETTEPETTEPETTTEGETTTDGETTADGETTVGGETTTDSETTADPDAPIDPDEIIDLGDGTVMIGDKHCLVITLLKWGYRDAKGKTVIEPRFKMAYTFSSEGLAAVLDFGDRISFIDKKGNIKISLVENEVISHPDQSRVTVKQQFLGPINNDVSALGSYYFDHGYVMVRFIYENEKDGKLIHNENRLVSTSGKYFNIPAGYKLVNYSDGIMMLEKNGKYGYMDLEGGWCAPPVYSEASPYIQGLAAVGTPDGKMGLVDTEGNYVLPLCFDYVSNVSSGYVATYSELRGWEIYCVIEK